MLEALKKSGAIDTNKNRSQIINNKFQTQIHNIPTEHKVIIFY